jgi:hypothetical protein
MMNFRVWVRALRLPSPSRSRTVGPGTDPVTCPCAPLEFAVVQRLATAAAGHDQHSGSDRLMADLSNRDFGFDIAQPERRYDVKPVNAGPSASSFDRRPSGVGVCKRAGSCCRVGTLVIEMAGCAVAIAKTRASH